MPEGIARETIDSLLVASGWDLQNRDELNRNAAEGSVPSRATRTQASSWTQNDLRKQQDTRWQQSFKATAEWFVSCIYGPQAVGCLVVESFTTQDPWNEFRDSGCARGSLFGIGDLVDVALLSAGCKTSERSFQSGVSI